MKTIEINPYGNIIKSYAAGNSSFGTTGMVRRYRFSETDEFRAFTSNYVLPTAGNILDYIKEVSIKIEGTVDLTGDWTSGNIKVCYFGTPVTLTANTLWADMEACENNVIGEMWNGSSVHTINLVSDGNVLFNNWNMIKNGLFFYFEDDTDHTQRVYTVTKATLLISYLDIESPPVISLTSPFYGSIILSTQSVNLAWEYSQDADVPQSHIDVEYSDNDGETWNILFEKIKWTSHNYSFPASLLPNKLVKIRVRAYTTSGTVVGLYDDTSIYIKVQASTSSVTCNGKPLPTISWTSSAQIAYQVRFADYDSGARYGTTTSFTVPYFYADGYYPVQVRTQASDGTWSEWTELEYVQITNTAPANTVTLTAVPTRHAVVLNWTDSGTAETYIVYRNHIPVYIGTDTTYTDIAANGECTYYVRAIQSKDYSQSNSVTVNAYPKTDCLYDFASMRWIPLKYSLQERSRNYSSSADVIYKKYAGRTKPVAFSSGHTVRQMSGAYVFKTREETLRLRNTAGKTVIFKDTRGGTIIGILNNPDITVQRKLYAVTFLVTETDYIEEREYAAE